MKLQIVDTLPGQNRTVKLDTDLLEALAESFRTGAKYALDVAEVPAVTRKGVTRQDTATADAFIRRHAAHVGCGVKVRVQDESTVVFQAVEKKIVPTGADRKPRTKRATV
jgi:hypothetical protein